MAFNLSRDVFITILSGVFAWIGLPVLIGTPGVPAFFLTGVVVALPIATTYAMGILAANKMPLRAMQVLGILAYLAGVWPLMGRFTLDLVGLLPLVPPLVFIGLWAWQSKATWVTTLFRGLWLYGFSMVVLQYGLIKILAQQPYVQPIAFLVAVFYLNVRLASELLNP